MTYNNIIDLENQSFISESETKVTGDIITVVDYSGMSDQNGKEIKDNLINLDDEFIVIETNLNNKFKSIDTFNQDLLIYNRRTKIKYRTPSYYTKLI